jgi:hypothetical protein
MIRHVGGSAFSPRPLARRRLCAWNCTHWPTPVHRAKRSLSIGISVATADRCVSAASSSVRRTSGRCLLPPSTSSASDTGSSSCGANHARSRRQASPARWTTPTVSASPASAAGRISAGPRGSAPRADRSRLARSRHDHDAVPVQADGAAEALILFPPPCGEGGVMPKHASSMGAAARLPSPLRGGVGGGGTHGHSIPPGDVRTRTDTRRTRRSCLRGPGNRTASPGRRAGSAPATAARSRPRPCAGALPVRPSPGSRCA